MSEVASLLSYFLLVFQPLCLRKLEDERANFHVEFNLYRYPVGVGRDPQVHVVIALKRTSDLGYGRELVASLGSHDGVDGLDAVIPDDEGEYLV